ncbi:MAG: 4Fe-4S ferredoxin, partial [Nitrospirota bacterium]
QGILVSDDIVAIEQATTDLLLKAKPLPQSAAIAHEKQGRQTKDILFKLSRKPYRIQIEEAGRLGLGSRDYELIEI